MTNPISDDRLEELLQAKMPRALHPLGHEGDCMSCDLVFALRELQERRIEVAKYKAWAASCDSTPPEPPAPLPEQFFTAANGRLYRVWGDVSDCSSEAEDEPRMVIYSYADDTEPRFARESSNFLMFFKPVGSSENRTAD